MNRSGQYVTQPTGYKAFIPKPLPPIPSIKMDGALGILLSEAKDVHNALELCLQRFKMG